MDSVKLREILTTLVDAGAENWDSYLAPNRTDAVNAAEADIMNLFSGAGVVVRELEWEPIEQARSDEDPRTEVVGYEAKAFGTDAFYTIDMSFDGYEAYCGSHSVGDYDTLEAAKSACQADYARRVTSALVPGVVSDAEALAGDIMRDVDEMFDHALDMADLSGKWNQALAAIASRITAALSTSRSEEEIRAEVIEELAKEFRQHHEAQAHPDLTWAEVASYLDGNAVLGIRARSLTNGGE